MPLRVGDKFRLRAPRPPGQFFAALEAYRASRPHPRRLENEGFGILDVVTRDPRFELGCHGALFNMGRHQTPNPPMLRGTVRPIPSGLEITGEVLATYPPWLLVAPVVAVNAAARYLAGSPLTMAAGAQIAGIGLVSYGFMRGLPMITQNADATIIGELTRVLVEAAGAREGPERLVPA